MESFLFSLTYHGEFIYLYEAEDNRCRGQKNNPVGAQSYTWDFISSSYNLLHRLFKCMLLLALNIISSEISIYRINKRIPPLGLLQHDAHRCLVFNSTY